MRTILWLSLLSFILSGACALCPGTPRVTPSPTATLERGLSRLEVVEIMGAPDRREEIIIPEGPFYGPQESLAGTLPSGEVVEEWVYTRGEIELYIWFWGEDPAIRDGWRVIDFVEYPASAVF